MNLISFDMPDTVDELATWLEKQIVDQHLSELVAELAAIHQVRSLPADSVSNILGTVRLASVLGNGLKILTASDIKKLLTRPYCLLDLQELIFSEGGPYWRQVPRSDEVRAASKLSWQSLQDKLTEGLPDTNEHGASAELAIPKAMPQEMGAWYRRPWPWVINLATAAAIFVAVYFTFRVPYSDLGNPQPSRLVWTSPEDLSKPASPEQYWHRLASVKQWWFSEKPTNKVQLAMRMGQLSEGCSVLIIQEHKQLPPADGELLMKKCRDWAKELNGYILDLHSGDADFQEIQKKVDALVIRLSDKLENGMKG